MLERARALSGDALAALTGSRRRALVEASRCARCGSRTSFVTRLRSGPRPAWPGRAMAETLEELSPPATPARTVRASPRATTVPRGPAAEKAIVYARARAAQAFVRRRRRAGSQGITLKPHGDGDDDRMRELPAGGMSHPPARRPAREVLRRAAVAEAGSRPARARRARSDAGRFGWWPGGASTPSRPTAGAGLATLGAAARVPPARLAAARRRSPPEERALAKLREMARRIGDSESRRWRSRATWPGPTDRSIEGL